MRRLAAFLGALAFASTASAETTPTQQDIANIEQCVRSVGARGNQRQVFRSCTELIAGPCRNGTTLEIADCLMRETNAWDTWLNAWWKPMRTRAEANGSWERLLAAQRQWIKDRDAECFRAYDSVDGGSLRVIYGAACHRDLAARKAIEFYFSLYR